MTFRKNLWEEAFLTLPNWPCPSCSVGELIAPETPQTWRTALGEQLFAHEAWEPDWYEARFLAIAECSNKSCKEKAVITGLVAKRDDSDPEFGPHYQCWYSPECIRPPSVCITLPAELPDEICNEIRAASALLWLDRRRAANALRSSIEMLLTDRKIARTTKSKKGKRIALTLHSRLDIFASKNAEAASLLYGIKVFGNRGSHGNKSDIEHSELLDAFEIVEHALPLIYKSRSKAIAAKAKKLGQKKH